MLQPRPGATRRRLDGRRSSPTRNETRHRRRKLIAAERTQDVRIEVGISSEPAIKIGDVEMPVELVDEFEKHPRAKHPDDLRHALPAEPPNSLRPVRGYVICRGAAIADEVFFEPRSVASRAGFSIRRHRSPRDRRGFGSLRATGPSAVVRRQFRCRRL
jgi:hypothetical protein